MFFKSLFMRFSFIRKWVKRKTKESLFNLLEKVEHQGSLEKDDITTLHSIVKASVVSFNEELILGTTDSINFYTNTSVRALKALDKKEVISINLGKSNDLSLLPGIRRFDEWYSNQESVEEFVSMMSLRLEQQVMLNSIITKEDPTLDKWRNNLRPIRDVNTGCIDFEPMFMLTEDDEDFLQSQLYRILLLDLMGILWFYMNHQSD